MRKMLGRTIVFFLSALCAHVALWWMQQDKRITSAFFFYLSQRPCQSAGERVREREGIRKKMGPATGWSGGEPFRLPFNPPHGIIAFFLPASCVKFPCRRSLRTRIKRQATDVQVLSLLHFTSTTTLSTPSRSIPSRKSVLTYIAC